MTVVVCNDEHVAGLPRRGVATLWVILALPVMLLLLCLAVESGRLLLAQQQLSTALESAALAAVKDWGQTGRGGTMGPRQVGIDFAQANAVLGRPLLLDANFSFTSFPNENASCEGDLVFGAITQTTPNVVFDAGSTPGCVGTAGPNLAALIRTSSAGWQQVIVPNRNYASMVVIGTPNYTVATTPSVVRIRNASGNGFEFQVQSVNSGNPIAGISVHFMIVEEGVYSQATDGVAMEAVKFNSTRTDFAPNGWVGRQRPFQNSYTRPVVVGQVMTFNDPGWSVFWSRGRRVGDPSDATTLRVGKHAGEDPNRRRATEQVGYIVVEQGSWNLQGVPLFAFLGPDTIAGVSNGAPFTYGLPNIDSSTVVASQSGVNANDGGWSVLYGPNPLTPTGLQLAIDEDQLEDVERSHTTENVMFLLSGTPASAGAAAVRAQARIEVDWAFTNLFGCRLASATVSGDVVAVFDCTTRRARLIEIDQFVCP